jgi:hypothetical protein
VFGVLRRHLGQIFKELAQHKESQVKERLDQMKLGV